MTDTITVITCPECDRNMTMEVIEYSDTSMIYGQIVKHQCKLYRCSGCFNLIRTMDIYNFNQVAKEMAYKAILQELLKE